MVSVACAPLPLPVGSLTIYIPNVKVALDLTLGM